MGFFRQAQLNYHRQMFLITRNACILSAAMIVFLSGNAFQVKDAMAKDCTTVWDDAAPLLTVKTLGKVVVYSKARGQIAITISPGVGVEPQTIRDVAPDAALAFDEFMSGLCLDTVKDAEGPPPGGPDDIEISFEAAEPLRLGRVRNTGGDFLILDDENYMQFFALLEKL